MIELPETDILDTTPQPGGDGHIVMTGQGTSRDARIPVLYASAIEKAGGYARVYSPFDHLRADERIPPGLDVTMDVDPEDTSPLDGAVGLLLPGGGDIDPINYGEPRHPRTRRTSRERDRLELTLLREALRRDMPILAICRGFQLLNVCFGGTLDQHLADDSERLDHDRDMPRAEPVHRVKIADGCWLAEVFQGNVVPVNSHHHQGLGRISDELEEVAWAGDGVLEAVIARNYTWVVGVQWHPEVMAPLDHRQLRLFESFVEETGRYAAERSAA